MIKLLVTGASGLLGVNLALAASQRGYDVIGWTHQHPLSSAPFTSESVDLLQYETVSAKLEEIKPDLIIHCAAMANVEEASRDPKTAHRINADVPGILAEEAARLGSRFIHISTDAVFDGVQGDYSESTMPHPLNAYARTKLEGEQAVCSANPRATIARVVFYGWSLNGQRSLAEFFYNHLEAERPVPGYTDMYFTPLYVGHLADILLRMGGMDMPGTYHVFGSESLSKYAFGVSLARQFGFDETLVTPVATPTENGTVRRPLQLTMRTEKISEALGEQLPSISEGLAALQADVQSGLRARVRAMGQSERE